MDLSIIVPCFKRLDHLRVTLPILDRQAKTSRSEVIVSCQGCKKVGEWLRGQILSRKLRQVTNVEGVRTDERFRLPEARNDGARNTRGEFLLHMDCDIFCNEGFVQAVLDKIDTGKMNKNSYLTIGPIPNRAGPGYNGILCLHKDTYWRLGGYDENLQNYGYHDTRFILKCIAADLSHVWLPHGYVCHIDHEDDLRVANYPEKDISKSYTQNVERTNANS